MATLQPSGTASTSIDGSTVFFTDTTNYAAAGIPVTSVTRNVIVFDANGNTVTVLNFPTNSSLTATFTLTNDMYLTFNMSYVNGGNTYTGTFNYYSVNYYGSAQVQNSLLLDCSCSNTSLCTYMTKAREYYNAGVTAYNNGQGVDAQNFITAANAYITQTN